MREAHVATAAAKSLQSCPTLCNPIDGSPLGSLSLGFSRQEHWSGLPFPSPMHESESESEVAQACLTLSDPMDYSPPGSSVHRIFQARVLEWGAIADIQYCISFGEGNGNPLQYSCLGNAMDGGAWQGAVHGVTKSQTRLSS